MSAVCIDAADFNEAKIVILLPYPETYFVYCRVFEAFGKVLSVQLAPDVLRPGKHRYISILTVRLNSLCSPILSIVIVHIPLWVMYSHNVELIRIMIHEICCLKTLQ